MDKNLANKVCFEFWSVQLDVFLYKLELNWNIFELMNPPSPSPSHAMKRRMNCTDAPNMTQFNFCSPHLLCSTDISNLNRTKWSLDFRCSITRVKMTHKGGAGNIFLVNAFPVGHSGEQDMLTAH